MTVRRTIRLFLTILTILLCWEFGSRMTATPRVCGSTPSASQNQ